MSPKRLRLRNGHLRVAGPILQRMHEELPYYGVLAEAAAFDRYGPKPTAADLITGGGVVVLEPDRDDRPRASHPDSAACRLVRVPADPADLRARDPDLVLRWRMALRKVLVSARSDGLRLTEVTRDGWYVLAERPTDHDREVAR